MPADAVLSRDVSAPWREGDWARTVPLLAQLSEDEIAYLHWLASRESTRDGLILDLGALAGGSAYALASGSACHGERAARIMSYDSFVATETEVAAGLFRTEVGASTMGVYRKNLARYEHRVTPRAMMIPEFAAGAELASVYPEGEPIAVLFVDCAKMWGVHHTILRAFGPHLEPGSVIVQQDFRGPLVYLGLHMYQLRHRVRPVHSTFGASVGFEVLEPITGADVDALWRPEDMRGGGLERAVEEAGAGLDEMSPAPLSPWLTLAAGGFCAQNDRPDDAVAFVERAWSMLPGVVRDAPGEEARRAFSGLWALAIEKTVRQLDHYGHGDEAAFVRGLRTWGEQRKGPSLRETLWRQVAARCSEIGEGRVALYGCGRHTDWLLHTDIFAGASRVVCVIDDATERHGTIAGVPVTGAEDAPAFDVVVPSSDAHEAVLFERAQQLAGERGVRALPVYTASG